MAFVIVICLIGLASGGEMYKWVFIHNGFGLMVETHMPVKWPIKSIVFGLLHEQVCKWVCDVICVKEF